MKVFLCILILIILIACNLSNKPIGKKSDFQESNLSKDDSFRLSIGLIPLKEDWILDTTEYETEEATSSIGEAISDTINYKTRKQYILKKKDSSIENRKMLEYSSSLGKLINETDIYIKYNTDSSLKIDIIYSYNYLENNFYCTTDTLDLIKEKQSNIKLKALKKDWERINIDSKKTGTIPDGTSYSKKEMDIWQGYLKIHVLSRDEAQLLIKEF